MQGAGPLQPHAFAGGAPWQVNEELANKVAELTVLRNRMQQMERENTRLENELVQAKGTQPGASQKSTAKQADLERATEQVQYLRQDLLSSEDERKRLKLTLQQQEQELDALRRKQDARPTVTPAPPKAPVPEAAPRMPPQLRDARPANMSTMSSEREGSSPYGTPEEKVEQGKSQILLQEFARWETLSEEPREAWYQLRAAVASFPGQAVVAAAAAARVARAAQGAGRRQAARVVRMWLGLFPSHAREIANGGEGIFDALGQLLHTAIQHEKPKRDHGEILALLLAFWEAASKLRGSELMALKSLLSTAGGDLYILLSDEPTSESLHLECLRLLEALMACPELFGMAHQAESKENVLLAAADLLVIPSVEGDERDTLERQRCRVASLKLFSRCCATASLDFVLQLRAEEGMDTVLQSLVLLCHHDLLCLLMYGNPWRSAALTESRQQRLQAVERSLFLLASFAWQISPFRDGLDVSKDDNERSFARLALQFGRTQVLLPSIVDMVCQNECEDFEPFRSSVSALRLLIEEPEIPAAKAEGSAPSQAPGGLFAKKTVVVT